MERDKVRRILDLMAELGVVRITYDPCVLDPIVEIWSRTGRTMDDRHREFWRPSRGEIEYYAREYDKCFGTAPRSDEK